MRTATPARTPVPSGGEGRAGRPLRAVLDALRDGAGSVAEVAARTGLPGDVVSGAVDHLARLGRLTVSTLSAGCPGGGCGTCPVVRAGVGCDSAGAQANRSGPVLVTLTVR